MSKPTLDYLQDRLSAATELAVPDAELTFRSMFGGISAYVSERVFASLSNIGLALKLSPTAQTDLLAFPDAKRLRYEPDAPESKQYIVVPHLMLEAPGDVAPWVKLSVEYVRSLPAPKKKLSR